MVCHCKNVISMAAPRIAGNLSPVDHVKAGTEWFSKIGTERATNNRGFAESGLRHLLPAARAYALEGKHDNAIDALLPAVETIHSQRIVVDVGLMNQVRQIARDLSGKNPKARALIAAAR